MTVATSSPRTVNSLFATLTFGRIAMWLTAANQRGVAAWRDEGRFWPLDVSANGGVIVGTAGAGFRLSASGSAGLPELRDQYVRGDELHLSFPQAETHEFGFKLRVRPIVGLIGPDRIGFELMVSIQTTWLDSHPTLDLGSAQPKRAQRTGVEAGDARFSFDTSGGDLFALLGRHDAPFTTVVDEGDETRLRLFGQFLEKGVIRRARPWILIGLEGAVFSESDLGRAADELESSPIPLS